MGLPTPGREQKPGALKKRVPGRGEDLVIGNRAIDPSRVSQARRACPSGPGQQ